MSEVKVGYVPINENPCALCCLNLVCTKDGFCKCDEYWKEHPEDMHNSDSEVYFFV